MANFALKSFREYPRKHLPVGLLAIIIVFSRLSFLHAEDMEFVKEYITIKIVASDTVELQGMYYFRNTTAKECISTLFYPFPIDSTLPFPCSVVVDQKKHVRFEAAKNGISFKVHVDKQNTDSIKIIYKQYAPAYRFVYILTSTQAWKQALEQSSFRINVPYQFTLSFMSYESDSVKSFNDYLQVGFVRKNFMPDRDFVMEWK